MLSKQPDFMPNTDADASDVVLISENADEDTDAASAENRAVQVALPAIASDPLDGVRHATGPKSTVVEYFHALHRS